VSEALHRIDAAIAGASQHNRVMLEVFRDHWLAEVGNDVPAIMATLPDDRVTYRFDGLGLLIPEYLTFDAPSDAQALYQGAADGGLPMAGPFEEERWAFADWGMVFEGINVAIIRGHSLHLPPYPLDADGLYLARWRSMSSHPIDVERRLMLGEHVFCGGLVSLDAVGEEAVAEMLS
jgi:hypothetical protein